MERGFEKAWKEGIKSSTENALEKCITAQKQQSIWQKNMKQNSQKRE